MPIDLTDRQISLNDWFVMAAILNQVEAAVAALGTAGVAGASIDYVNSELAGKASVPVQRAVLAQDVRDSLAKADAGTTSTGGTATISDATTTTKGVLRLGGDLAGTANEPRVAGLAGKYVLPLGGIPSTDLAEAVRAQLTRATNAVQKTDIGVAGGVVPVSSAGRLPIAYLPTGSTLTLIWSATTGWPAKTGPAGTLYVLLGPPESYATAPLTDGDIFRDISVTA